MNPTTLPSADEPETGGSLTPTAAEPETGGSLTPTGNAPVESAPPLPALLTVDRTDEIFQQLVAELEPRGVLETEYVRQMARHAAAGELAHQSLAAVRRQVARLTAPLLATTAAASGGADTLLAAVACSGGVDRADRRARAHARGFQRAQERLRALQTERRRPGQTANDRWFPFARERHCEEFMAERFRRGQQPCPRCNATRGVYLASRRAWQCAGCRRQSGLREGTVMHRSALPLLVWFRAIAALLAAPNISNVALAERAGINRGATARQVAARIRRALAAEDGGRRLAGLDQFLVAAQGAAESSVAAATFFSTPHDTQKPTSSVPIG